MNVFTGNALHPALRSAVTASTEAGCQMQVDGLRQKKKMACCGLLIRGSGGAENLDFDNDFLIRR